MRQKKTHEEKRLSTSVAFDQDILKRIEKVKGRMSRSSFINIALDRELIIKEQRLESI